MRAQPLSRAAAAGSLRSSRVQVGAQSWHRVESGSPDAASTIVLADAGIPLPVLAVVGATSGSRALPDWLVPIAHDLMSLTIDDAAHYVAEEKPEMVAVALDTFAAEVFGTSESGFSPPPVEEQAGPRRRRHEPQPRR